MSDLAKLVQERTRRVEAQLDAALRVEIGLYLSRHIEGRVVNRPHWMRRTPRIMFEEMRAQTDRRVDALLAPLRAKINDVRAKLGLGGGAAADEFAPVAGAIGPALEDAAKDLLLQFFVPGDGFPDRADDRSADLSPRFDLGYEPTIGLRWAFTQVRMMDVARLTWEQQKGRPLAPSFEVRMFLPEALPADPPA